MVLATPLKSEDNSDNLIDKLHAFAYSLLGQPAEGCDADQWKCPLVCWLAVSSVKRSGGFMLVGEYTQVLAKWKYLLRSLHLFQASQRSKKEQTPLFK